MKPWQGDRRGFCYYEWRQGYERIELDFAVWIEEPVSRSR